MYIVVFKRKPGPGGGVFTSQTFESKAAFDREFKSSNYDDEDIYEQDVTPKRAAELVKRPMVSA